MKRFDELVVEKPVPQVPQKGRAESVKYALLATVTYPDKVMKALKDWLFSFNYPLSKGTFAKQLASLSYDTEIAITQLKKATDQKLRYIPKAPQATYPETTATIVELIQKGEQSIAVIGTKVKPYIKQSLKALRQFGEVFVYDVEEMKSQYIKEGQMGSYPAYAQQALDAQMVIVVGLEKRCFMEWHQSAAINTLLAARRKAKDKVTLVAFSTTNLPPLTEIKDNFSIYTIKEVRDA